MDPILAHILPGQHGFFAGLMHPITGADHLVAAVGVGVLATLGVAREPARGSDNRERRAGSPATRIVLPASFVSGMTLGGALALLGVSLPHVEAGIALSLVAVGVALTLRKLGPEWIAATVLALLAVFHGHAHLSEADPSNGIAAFAVGLIAATALLHAVGIAIATLVARTKFSPIAFARVAGAATVAFGVLKLAGVA